MSGSLAFRDRIAVLAFIARWADVFGGRRGQERRSGAGSGARSPLAGTGGQDAILIFEARCAAAVAAPVRVVFPFERDLAGDADVHRPRAAGPFLDLKLDLLSLQQKL